MRLSWLFAAGGGVALIGIILRLSARSLAWPRRWSYEGDRENTSWAFAESAYVDISHFLMGFGLAVLLVAVWLLYRRFDEPRHSP